MSGADDDDDDGGIVASPYEVGVKSPLAAASGAFLPRSPDRRNFPAIGPSHKKGSATF